MSPWTDRTVEMLVRLGVPQEAVALYQAIPCLTTYALAFARRRPLVEQLQEGGRP